MSLLLLLTSFAQTPDLPFSDFVEDSARLLRFTTALNALEEDPPLLELHRGLSEYLSSHTPIGLTETAYQHQLRILSYKRLADAFEEALHEDSEMQQRFNEFYGALSYDNTLNARYDELLHIELREGRRNPVFSRAIAYLKSHPDEAATFLENPGRLIPTPDELYKLRSQFRSDRELQGELKNAFDQLNRGAAFHYSLLPWWQTAYNADGGSNPALIALELYLRRYPQRYWVWHRHNTEWSADPRAKSWMQHLYGQIRRDAGLRDTYFEFSIMLRERPDMRQAVEKSWENKMGPISPWPPAGWPPELPPFSDTGAWSVDLPEQPTRPSREAILPDRPRTPRAGIKVPARPQRPAPVKPEKPQSTPGSVQN